jgi:hypothetical protein
MVRAGAATGPMVHRATPDAATDALVATLRETIADLKRERDAGRVLACVTPQCATRGRGDYPGAGWALTPIPAVAILEAAKRTNARACAQVACLFTE